MVWQQCRFIGASGDERQEVKNLPQHRNYAGGISRRRRRQKTTLYSAMSIRLPSKRQSAADGHISRRSRDAPAGSRPKMSGTACLIATRDDFGQGHAGGITRRIVKWRYAAGDGFAPRHHISRDLMPMAVIIIKT